MTTFGQLSSSLVNHCLFAGNNVSDIPKVELSDLEDISNVQFWGEYAGQTDIVGKDSN